MLGTLKSNMRTYIKHHRVNCNPVRRKEDPWPLSTCTTIPSTRCSTASPVSRTWPSALGSWACLPAPSPSGERLGQGVLRSQLADLMYHCEGVANFNIVSPRKDVAGSPEVLPQLGRVTTEEMK